MHNFKFILSYDGTNYLGWQKTKMGPSIEATLESALGQMLQEKVSLQAASRTDAGVHAKGQTVNVFTEKDISLRSLNGLLPPDICIHSIEKMPASFHPTLDCSGKEYHYFICNSEVQIPFHRKFSWHFHSPLSLELMREAASLFIGKQDFSSFSNLRTTDSIREITSLEVLALEDGRIKIAIRGNRFLYKMVRNIVGTLVYIGCGKLSLEALPQILASKDRTQAGITAPAHGLSLFEVIYP